MAALSRKPKIRNVPLSCEEKNSCQEGDRVELFCVECDTFQCGNCAALLHIPPNVAHHERIEMEEKTCATFCRSDASQAIIYCLQCKSHMCVRCDERMHNGKRSSHERWQFLHHDVDMDLDSSTLDPPSFNLDASQMEIKENYYAETGKEPKVSNTEVTESPYVSSEGFFDSDGPSLTRTKLVTENEQTTRAKLQKMDFVEKVKISSVLLLNDKEELMVSDGDELAAQLHCPPDCKLKVVSIFGNTGDGKSHTLNHTFFGGQPVFKTSSSPRACTVGAWLAYSEEYKAVFLDTEGLLGSTPDEHKRTRLLMKILAISDVVIFRTRAERLHNDMFVFLAHASEAYLKHFQEALKAVSERGNLEAQLSNLGPNLVIFHETQNTDTLGEFNVDRLEDVDWTAVKSNRKDQVEVKTRSPEEHLRIRFLELGLEPQAYSCIRYVGTKTSSPPTDFSKIKFCISNLLKDNSVRAPRSLQVVLSALKALNRKFSGDISNLPQHEFPDEFFTCAVLCNACGARCTLSMNHEREGERHTTKVRCKYQAQFDNQVFMCKLCYNDGQEMVVVPKTSQSQDGSWVGLVKYAWAGFVLECPQHGIIYRSRQYWYGNKLPEEKAVKTALKHVWPGELGACGEGTHNAARKLIEGVSTLAGAVGNVTAVPTRKVSSWMADMIAPTYWTPNSQIKNCGSCKKPFAVADTKHHCRSCGEGFCKSCSSKEMPVPWRGWGTTPLRVCDPCFDKYHVTKEKPVSSESSSKEGKVTARYMGEVMQVAVQYVGGAVDYSKALLVDAARPSYWMADAGVVECGKCKTTFTEDLLKHHCRACGKIFCDRCSSKSRPVPSRGWDHPVRVCDTCAHLPDL